MGKKKFIDKKKSATFQLVYRETAEADDDNSARIFTRVDGGYSHVKGFSEEDPRSNPDYGYNSDGDEEDASMFADAEEEDGDGDDDDTRSRKTSRSFMSRSGSGQRGPLPEHARVELVELGFPDDGYDYLQHMRKIGVAGVGGAFVPTNRLQLDRLRTDVKVYDSSKVAVQPAAEADDKRIIEAVGSSTRPLRRSSYLEEGLDPEVAAALANSEGSQFDSADELEDDFVVFANNNGEGPSSQDVLDGVTESKAIGNVRSVLTSTKEEYDEDDEEFSDEEEEPHTTEIIENKRPRPSRLLDEQFEMLALREYDDDEFGDFEEEDVEARGHADISQFDDVLSEFLTNTDIYGDKYMTPAEIAKKAASDSKFDGSGRDASDKTVQKDSSKLGQITSKVVKVEDKAEDKRLQVGKGGVDTLNTDSEDDDLVILDVESEGERSNWDCETVVSTLSNVDNHPGKISAPGKPRHKQPTLEKVLEDKEAKGGIIRLRGKQHLPTDFLPVRPGLDKNIKKSKNLSKSEDTDVGQKAGSRAGETPLERKARKAAVKAERREARASKKALKILYKDETQRAQHGAAHTGPSGIHLP